MSTDARVERLAAAVTDKGLDALLVTDRTNLRWTTGFTGSNGLAVAGPQVRRFYTDFRYAEQSAKQVPAFETAIVTQDKLLEAVREAVGPGATVGFDDANVSVREHGKLAAALEGVELVPAGGLVEDLRLVKDTEEVEKIRAATALADDVLRWLLEAGMVGRTEREVAVAIEHEMRLRGASGPSFPSIVAAAEHGALPHAEPRDVPIARDTLVTIDMGAQLDGWCSDCTRTFATGHDLPSALADAYALVERAQAAALDAVVAGAEGKAVDAVARDLITEAGHGEHFGHGLGHGVGLEIHEGPRLARTSDAVLAEGMVVTVEPGVYLAGIGGVRIEDLCVVTAGAPEVLTTLPKGLTVVD